MRPSGNAALVVAQLNARSASASRAARVRERFIGLGADPTPAAGAIRRGHEGRRREWSKGSAGGVKASRKTGRDHHASAVALAARIGAACTRRSRVAHHGAHAAALGGQPGQHLHLVAERAHLSITPAACSPRCTCAGKELVGGNELGKFTSRSAAPRSPVQAMPNCVTFRNTASSPRLHVAAGVPKHMTACPPSSRARAGVSRGRLTGATCAGCPAARRDAGRARTSHTGAGNHRSVGAGVGSARNRHCRGDP